MKNNNKFRLDVWGAITLGTIALYALFLLCLLYTSQSVNGVQEAFGAPGVLIGVEILVSAHFLDLGHVCLLYTSHSTPPM